MKCCASIADLLKASGRGSSFYTENPDRDDSEFFGNVDDIDAATVKKGPRRQVLLYFYDGMEPGQCCHPYIDRKEGRYMLIDARWRPKLHRFEVLVLFKSPNRPPVFKWFELNALYQKIA